MLMKILTTQELNQITGGSGIGKGDDPKEQDTQPQQAKVMPTLGFNHDEKALTP